MSKTSYDKFRNIYKIVYENNKFTYLGKKVEQYVFI